MTPDDHATLKALIVGIDATAREHEQEWGIDRLPTLVDDETRIRFFKQQARWSAAIAQAYETEERRPLSRDDLEKLQSLTDGLRRGWLAMAAQASERGARGLRAEVWELSLSDGSKAALVRSVSDIRAIADDGLAGRYVSIWTLDEIVNVIAANLAPALAEAKAVWKDATIVKGRLSDGPKWNPQGDDIPFGDASPDDASPDDASPDDATLAFEKPGFVAPVVAPIAPVGRADVALDF